MTSLEKLVNLVQNLVKAHMVSLHHNKSQIHVDLSYHFIKHLFLEGIIDQPLVTHAILTNQIQ